jgi:hypothetical protein
MRAGNRRSGSASAWRHCNAHVINVIAAPDTLRRGIRRLWRSTPFEIAPDRGALAKTPGDLAAQGFRRSRSAAPRPSSSQGASARQRLIFFMRGARWPHASVLFQRKRTIEVIDRIQRRKSAAAKMPVGPDCIASRIRRGQGCPRFRAVRARAPRGRMEQGGWQNQSLQRGRNHRLFYAWDGCERVS